jgi:glycosyltransferase involved in cell wall biosynthesis
MAQSFKGILDLCAASVVSSQKLQQEFLSRSNVHYIQSALDERLIIRKSPRGHWKKPIVIGYMGSATHDDDFKMLLPALKAIQARYASGVKFQVIGALSPEKIQKWDSFKGLDLTVLAPLPQECEYQLFLPWFTGNIHWDIAVAPLEDTSFNQYKSDIKFLDYTAAGVPGVYSSVTSYGDTIQDHQTGLLVQNSPEAWINGLEELIESPQLRLTVMDHAEQYLYRNRTLASCAQNWVRTLTEIMG